MTAYTSSQVGVWSSSATWGGVGVPGSGDTVSIGHVVTVDANTTIGTSPNDNTTNVVLVTNNGQVLIPTGITLTVLGNMYLNPTSVVGISLQINGTGRLLFDGSAVGSSRFYWLRCDFRARVHVAGTDDANRATIESNPAGGDFRFTLQGSAPCLPSFNYVNINRCGNAATNGFSTWNYALAASDTISWTNVTLNNCGAILFRANNDTNSITLDNVQHYSANTSLGMQVRVGSGTGAVVTINDCVIDTIVYFDGSQNCGVTNSYFGYGFYNAVGNLGFHNASNNIYINRAATSKTWYGSLDDFYMFHYAADSLNYFIKSFRSTAATDSVSGLVLDYGDTSPNQPDGLGFTDLPTGNHYTVNNNICLPDSAGQSSGAWANLYFGFDLTGTISFEHNTICTSRTSGGEQGIILGERPGRAGVMSAYKSNLSWTPSGQTGSHKLTRHNLSTLQDFAYATDVDYNWGWNLAAGSEGNGYECSTTSNAMFSTGTPDVNGGTGDPDFVDPTRNLVRYDIDGLGSSAATAWADATAYAVGDVRSASDAGYFGGSTINWRCKTAHTSATGNATNGKPGAVSGFRTNWEPMTLYRLREDMSRIGDLRTWVRDGFAVQNVALEDAGHDGVTIGAGDFFSSSVPVSVTSIVGAGSGVGGTSIVSIGQQPASTSGVGTGQGNASTFAIGVSITAVVGNGTGLGGISEVSIGGAVSVTGVAGSGSGVGTQSSVTVGVRITSVSGSGSGEGFASSIAIGHVFASSPGAGTGIGKVSSVSTGGTPQTRAINRNLFDFENLFLGN